MLRIALLVLLVVHGLIHLLGFAKAFGFAALPQLRQPIRPPMGLVWLAAALALLVAAALLAFDVRAWWIAATIGVVISQIAIASAWRDAKAGSLANVILLVPVALSFLDARSTSLRSRYADEAAAALAAPHADAPAVTEADLATLPPAVATYLRRVGVVGRPPTRELVMRFRGQLRSAPDAPWMDVTGTQVSTFGDEPTRRFFVEGAMKGVPFQAFHRFVGPDATMEVRAAALVTMAFARGPEMNQSETVTILNDMCMLAPSTLLDRHVRFESMQDARTVRVSLERRGITVSAVLDFDAEGDLVRFTSDDRYLSADGKAFARHRWVTPLHDYGDLGGLRLARHGEALWERPEGPLEYARFEILELRQRAPFVTMSFTFAMASGRPAGLARSFT